MLKPFTVVVLLLFAAAAGFYIPRLMQYPHQSEFSVKLVDPDPKWLTPAAANSSYGCEAVTEANTFEDRLAGSNAMALAGFGTDKMSLKITGDGKGVVVLFAAAVAAGVTEASDPIPITYKTDRYIMATGPVNFGASSLIFDLKTLKVIYSYTGQGMLGVKGQSILFTCR
jgi:hypothetical protein